MKIARRRIIQHRLWLLIVAAVVTLGGCGVHGLRVPQSPLLKFFVARSGHIAFVGTDGNLYMADQSGSKTPLTTDAQSAPAGSHVSYLSPTWGPKGQNIAFVRYLTNTSTGKSTVQLHVLDWHSKRNIVTLDSASLNPFYLDWSPGGSRVAVLSDSGGGHLQLGVVTADKPHSYVKLASGAPYYWTWSPDGKEIISHSEFTSTKSGQVSVIPVTDPARSRRIHENFGPFQAPSVLPGGDIVAAVQSGAGPRLATIDPATGTTTPFAAPETGGFVFSVSPNGKEVAYLDGVASQGGNTTVLNVWNLETKKPVASLEKQSTLAYYWSPDSSKIAFFTPAAQGTKVAAAYAQVPSLPRVDLKIIDVGSGKTWTIATFPLTRGLLATFPFTDQYQHSQTIWSPNGRYLLYTAYTKAGGPGVFVADASGNVGPTQIGDGDSAVWSWK